ncbi:MAG: putative cobyric acid synthase CobQ [Candidatus Saccharibacteria bacterium]|nr:putative cobyric acid synthase CobQ [Candidatus Saccharibacteria bacterium]
MTDSKTLTILQLYPNEMNIYGDRGNVLTLVRRAELHGFSPEVIYHDPGKPFPQSVDLVVGGGGQDSGQDKVQNDLLRINDDLHMLADHEIPMIMVCGMYQLFGRFFKTADGKTIKGIAIFDAETQAGPTRMIGNVILDTPFGEIIGYENHSGQTFLGKTARSFGKVKKGAGNNGKDGYEGAIYKNVYGTYLHGSLLPKNPVFADELIKQAAIQRYGKFTPAQIDDTLAEMARDVARTRPR